MNGMYNNIAKFQEFIAGATAVQINKAILFINMAGYYAGAYGGSCNDDELIILAIDYAKSNRRSIESYFLDNIDIDRED